MAGMSGDLVGTSQDPKKSMQEDFGLIFRSLLVSINSKDLSTVVQDCWLNRGLICVAYLEW